MRNFAHKRSSLLALVLFFASAVFAQDLGKPQITPTGIRIGERLTYNMSFEFYESAGFAEMYAVSRGKLGDADAVELRSKFKTTGIFSAAFMQCDEVRTTFVGYDSGSPLLIRRRDNLGASARETVTNYMTQPAPGFDLLSLIYKSRSANGTGSFNLVENDKTYSLTFQPQGAEHLKVDAGEFDTTYSIVVGDYLTERGISAMKVYYSTDEAHIPVQLRFRIAKNDFKISLSGIHIVEPEVETVPTPVPVATPRPTSTPRPTPTPYIDNVPLSGDLGFQLGEKLTYRISTGGRPLAMALLEARERKLISGSDSLILSASIVSVEQGNGFFSTSDAVTARVSPETLAPFEYISKTSGPLSAFTQSVRFDHRTGAISAGPNRVDAPIGTHSLLSLLYAIRSFNLTPSRDSKNPVNDTRVAVYWQDKAYIFMLRPFEPEVITVDGRKMMAQKVAVKTNNPQLDQLGITIWLSTDSSRVPLMLSLGQYQAELISQQQASVK
jgi:hypothetical protein